MKPILFVSFLFFLFSCKKEKLITNSDLELPDPYTTQHKNVFGCLVNGEKWLPGSEGSISINAILNYYYEDRGEFGLSASSTKGDIRESILIQTSFLDTGLYQNSSTGVLSRLNFSNPGNCIEYHRDSLVNDYIKIEHVDRNSGIIIGSFEDTGINSCGDTVIITDGRFKVTYK